MIPAQAAGFAAASAAAFAGGFSFPCPDKTEERNPGNSQQDQNIKDIHEMALLKTAGR